jgi:molecular chaperone GrpE
VTEDGVARDAPMDMLKSPSVLATALQSFKEALMNDDEENAVEMVAFVLPVEDEKSSLVSKITTLDAQFTTLRDLILRTSA